MSLTVNFTTRNVKMFDDVYPLVEVLRWTLDIAKQYNQTLVPVPEFGFCNVCQPVHADIARRSTQFIDLHKAELKELICGTCIDCHTKVWTADRFCFLLRNNRVVRRWMPVYMRN